MPIPVFLVTRATGQQGGATTRALLAHGARVHAVVRDPGTPAARELASFGVVLFRGDHDDLEAFRTAARGCRGLFLNQVEWPTHPDPARQAQGLLAACKDAGVAHVVASTSGWAGDRAKWDTPANRQSWLAAYNEHEMAVEAALREAGFPAGYTILRPFWFHANYLPPVLGTWYPQLLTAGELAHSFAPGAIFPHIGTNDIGRAAAAALLKPTAFAGREIELANENLTVDQVAAALQRVTGREVKLRSRTPEEEKKEEELVPWQRWASEVDLTVDTEAVVRTFGFRFDTLEESLSRDKDRLVAALTGAE